MAELLLSRRGVMGWDYPKLFGINVNPILGYIPFTAACYRSFWFRFFGGSLFFFNKLNIFENRVEFVRTYSKVILPVSDIVVVEIDKWDKMWFIHRGSAPKNLVYSLSFWYSEQRYLDEIATTLKKLGIKVKKRP
jgi:hypothetical protein